MELLNQRYEILESIAKGSDSEVFKANDTLKKRTVLIKAFFSNALQDWKRFQLIEREAKTLAQINHIQIPDFIDFFVTGAESEQTIYLVTEFIRGHTLSHKLAQGWRPDFEQWVSIADQLLQILHYIHAFHPPIVHRDIKPSNLIYSEFKRVFLVDFGGVQEHLESQGAGGSTMVGTLGYMAPEQLAGRAVPATDLFALGITLLELLTGQSAEELNPQNTALDLDTLLPGVDSPWRKWLHSLLELPLNKRESSAFNALRYIDLLRDKDVQNRTLFTPQDHKARLPEILHSLTLIERSEEDKSLVQGSLLNGRFEVAELIGSGTHSRVYRAQDQHRQAEVIVKELCLENIDNWKNLELFEREIQTMQKLQHKRIPRFIEAFDIREGNTLNWYLITEAIEGQTLEDKLKTGWRPTHQTIWDIAQQALEVLNYLHGLTPPLIHRDVKPTNILINGANDIYLIDFGAVQNRFWSEGGGGSTIIGTFGYMAPEQFGGKADPESDLYALAATLVRLLSLKHPIEIPFEATGLQFHNFVQLEPFYATWLHHCLKPLASERLSPVKAKTLLTDHIQGGKEASRWLQEHNMAFSQSHNQGQALIVPENITAEQLPQFINERTPTIYCDKEQLAFFPEDEQLSGALFQAEQTRTKVHLLAGIWVLFSLFTAPSLLEATLTLVDKGLVSPTLFLPHFMALILWIIVPRWVTHKINTSPRFAFLREHPLQSPALREKAKVFSATNLQGKKPGILHNKYRGMVLIPSGKIQISPLGITGVEGPLFLKRYSKEDNFIPFAQIENWCLQPHTPQKNWGALAQKPLFALTLDFKNPLRVDGAKTTPDSIWVKNNQEIPYMLWRRELIMPLNSEEADILKTALRVYLKQKEAQ